MLVTTTNTIEGKKIKKKYHGLITGEAIMGANLFKDLFAGIRDIVGGRSASYEKELRTAKQIAVSEMIENAKKEWNEYITSVTKRYPSDPAWVEFAAGQ